MPELPEVETIRRDLQEALLNKAILKLDIKKPKLIKGSIAGFKRQIESHHFVNVERRGKLLIFTLDQPETYLLIHLKMTGQLIYVDGVSTIAGGHNPTKAEQNLKLPHKYSHVILHFVDGSTLYYNDLRQFGYLQVVDRQGREAAERKFGPEPLSSAFSLSLWQGLVRRYPRSSVKKLLLNQTAIAGIGNIYADEICFRASIKPDRIVGQLKPKEVIDLFKSIKPILKLAIQHRGTTFNDYRDARGRKGNFVKLLAVYGRKGQSCQNCRQAVIVKIRHSGRGTHYCPNCQR
ncbi:MAG: bifunctional DNA-formamidopyrimidine glycosylase/DNA-(apurinic or apyrimidinic site) lyase [bacterium]|nr:bifunctional DNA-formamidopyrimidine glycosylase/DNA-(apurinic or apyrimidinic site) lyase [bacterium]